MNLIEHLNDKGLIMEKSITRLNAANKYYAKGVAVVGDKYIYLSVLGRANEQPQVDDVIGEMKVQRIVERKDGAVVKIYGGDSVLLKENAILAHNLSLSETDETSVILANNVYSVLGEVDNLQEIIVTDEQELELKTLGFQQVLCLN